MAEEERERQEAERELREALEASGMEKEQIDTEIPETDKKTD